MAFVLNEAVVSIKTQGLDKLQTDLNSVDKRLKRLGAGTAAKSLNADFRNTTRSANKLGESVGKVGNLLAVMPTRGSAAMSGYTGALGTATTAMGGLSLATIGATAGIAALVGAGAGLVAAVKSAGDLEARLAEVATISKDVANNIKGFSDQIGRLSIATRTDTGLLAEGLYQTISAGITDTADAMNFLEVSANAARAGLSSVGVAVSGLTSAVSAFGLEADDVGLVADKFFKTVEVGKLRFEDIASSIGSVAPLASQLGISLEELLAAGSALTLTGQTLSESFTNIQGVMNAVLRPSNEAVELAEQLGIEFSATALQTKGLTRFLKDLEIQAGGDVEVLGQLFGRIEGLRGVLALTGNQAESFAKNLNAIENAAGSAEKAVDIQNQTFEAQIALLKNQLSFALQTIGNELLPTVTDAVKDLTTSLNDVDWDKFSQDAENAIGSILSVVQFLGRTLDSIADKVALFDFLFIPGGGVPERVKQGAQDFRNNSPALKGFYNQNPEFLTSFGQVRRQTNPSVGLRTDLVAPPAAQPTAPQTTAPPTGLRRAIPLTPEQQDLAAQALAVSPDFIRSPAARQARSFRTGGQGGFVAPRAGTGIEAVTRSPIPGVQGELLAPGLGITEPSPASIVSDNLQPLADLTFPTTLPEELKTFEDALKNANTAQLGAFEALQTPTQNIAPLIEAEGKRLAEGFSLVGAAIEGGAAGGLPGALIAVGAEVLGMTEGFGRIQEAWNMLIGRLVQALEPIVTVAADLLIPVFDALGSVLEALTPLFQVVAQVIKLYFAPGLRLIGFLLGKLADGISAVVNFFTRIINVVIGLLNKLPFVNIQRIPEADERRRAEVDALDPTRQREGGVVAREDRIGQRGETIGGRPREGAIGDARGSSGGLRVSAITGASRDILVDALRPLRQLNTTFPAMLDVLEDIRDNMMLGGIARQPAMALPNVPNLQGFNPQRQNVDANIEGGQAFGNQGGVVINELHINVEQVADVADIDRLERRLAENLDLRQRNEGAVFPNNR